MPPKKKSKLGEESQRSENLTWTDEEGELLLGVVRSYASQKDFDGIEWESVKNKYEDIRQQFIDVYKQSDGKHDATLFTREKIASKIKDFRKKYKKAVDTGRRSGGGRTVATFYDLCNDIWSGCPATTSIENGLDAGDMVVVISDTTKTVEDEENDKEVTPQQEPSQEMTVVQTETVADKDNDEETEKTNNRRSLIEHIKEQRNSKLNKTKNVDQQQLSVLKEELTIKKEMISDMKENDRQYQYIMARFAATMENLSQTVSTMVGMIESGMIASQPSSTIPNWQQNNGGQQVLYGRVPNSSGSDQSTLHELGLY